MKLAAVTLRLSALYIANASIIGTHPIVKVINMLKDLKEKAIAEGQGEQVAYSKFEYWCSSNSNKFGSAIAEEKETIDELEDKRDGLKKEETSLTEEVSALREQIRELSASISAGDKQRKQEKRVYFKAHGDLESTISAVDKCLEALGGAEEKTELQMMLARKHMARLLSLAALSSKATAEQRVHLEAFAEGRPKQLAKGDKSNAIDKYDFKSENVVELLKQLKIKFEDDKLAVTKEEIDAANSWTLESQATKKAYQAAKTSALKKDTKLSATTAAIVDTQSSLSSTQGDLDVDSKSLSDTSEACRIKQSEWNERSTIREYEIQAMDQAMKILAKSTGLRTETPDNPILPASPVAFFLQLSQIPRSSNNRKMKAVVLLKKAAGQAKSRALEQLALEVAAHLNGPFDAVNNMVEKMIFRLMDEQKKEDEHKDWCDQEIHSTEFMEADKNDKISDLKAEIKIQNSKVSTLSDEIADAQALASEIETFMNEATEIRKTGKNENKLALKDSKDAQTSITSAIAVLQTFYKESGAVPKEPWEFIQKPVNLGKNPSTWDSGYSGLDKQPGGVLSLLEAVLSSFSKMQAETTSQEAQDQKEFEVSMKDNQIKRAEKKKEIEVKTAEKSRRAERITSLSGTKKNTQDELEKSSSTWST